MYIEMVDPGGTVMREIADPKMTRNDVAATYAWCIRQPDGIDFSAVNHAILDRWSMHALTYIKERAWKLVGQGPEQ